MPYRDARLPSVLVCPLFAFLLSGCDPAALTSSDTESFEPHSDFAAFSTRPVSPTVQAGLDAWRKPGRLMVENSYRMMLYRVQAYVTTHGLPDASQKKYKNTAKNWLRNMDIMEDFFEHAQTAHYAHNMALLAETRVLLGQPPA